MLVLLLVPRRGNSVPFVFHTIKNNFDVKPHGATRESPPAYDGGRRDQAASRAPAGRNALMKACALAAWAAAVRMARLSDFKTLIQPAR